MSASAPGRPVLHDEVRLDALRTLQILDTPPEPAYDDLAALAATVCRSPIAAINFVDDARHFTKAAVGLPGAVSGSVANELSFCAATVERPDGRLVIEDTRADAAWCGHPLVTGGPEVGFYAGVAIESAGERVGVVCAFGREPRTVPAADREALRLIAGQVSMHLDLRRRNAELHGLAVTDELTGLANRTLLRQRLATALARSRRTGCATGLVYVDVDDFKAINDRHGHAVGDRVLVAVARHLRAAVRDTDTVARIAGDEFVVLCPALPAPDVLDRVAARISAAAAPPVAPGVPFPGLSAGVALATPDDAAASLLERADEAMYARKRASRARRRPVA